MLITDQTTKGHLDKIDFNGRPDVTEAAELLYQLLDASYTCSGTCLETEINGQRTNIRSLYWQCRELIGQVQEGGEKTEFLFMSVLEQTFRDAYPLLLMRLEDIAEDGGSQVQTVLRLKKIFRENPYSVLWQEKAEKYRELVEKMGLKTDGLDYSDLTKIMDPLLDAFTLYQQKGPEIHKIRTGARSRKYPEVGASICRYRSEKELVDVVAGCGKEAVIVFGAVEKTNQQVQDAFYRWYYGHADERQRNTMRYDHISEEEYLSQTCAFSRCVYLCVKSGEAVWLMHMSYQTGGSHRFDGPKSKYYGGHRAGYVPYEVFYQKPPAVESDTTFLTIPRKGYLLSELMDDQQKAWFPVFIEETVEKFFRVEADPETDEWVLPEEAVAAIRSGEGEQSIIQAFAGLPDIPQYIYEVRAPEEVFGEGYMRELCTYFHVTKEDIASVPVLPVECGTPDAYENVIGEKVKKAYSRILAARIADFLEGKWEARGMVLDRIAEDKDQIIKEATEGRFASFLSIDVDGELETDGAVIHTKLGDCTESPHIRRNALSSILWACDATSGKAPVVWKLRPESTREYAQLLGMPEKELPAVIKWADAIHWFYQEYKNQLPAELTNEFLYSSEEKKDHSIYLPPLGNVNICMTKRTHKKMLAARGKV